MKFFTIFSSFLLFVSFSYSQTITSFISKGDQSFTKKLNRSSITPKAIGTIPNDARRSDSINLQKTNWFQADSFARVDPKLTNSYLELFFNEDPAATNPLNDLNSHDQILKSVSYILLALQDSAGIKKYFGSLHNLQLSYADSLDIRMRIEDIQKLVNAMTPQDRPIHYSLFATGDFLSTVQSNAISGSSSIASGTLGASFKHGNFGLTAKIILISTQDTVTSGYGTQLLSPAKGKGFGTGILGFTYDLWKDKTALRTWSANLFVAGSSQHWRGDSSVMNNVDSINANKDSIFTATATIFSVDLLANYCIRAKDSLTIGNNKYAIALNCNVGFAERILGGDILKPLKDPGSILHEQGYYAHRFPTTRKMFFGLEGGISISVGPILAEFTLYDFFNSGKDRPSVPGLTGLQAAFGASINLNLFHN